MELTEEELNEVNRLFKKVNTLFFYKVRQNAKNYSEIFFCKENDFRYFKFRYKGIEFEIYFSNGSFKYEQGMPALYTDEILDLIKYIKQEFTLIFNKEVEKGKLISYTFESGDTEQIMLNRCRKRSKIV